MTFSIFSIYGLASRIWRKSRFALFLSTIKPADSDVLLDVGGYPDFWTLHPQPVARIDAVNFHEVSWHPEKAPGHHIRSFLGDGCALKMPDRSYDIGFSNSVIEHVGSWEKQQAFASEIRRVAKSLWVQTPAYECPIEPHYMTPFIHWLPRHLHKRILRWFTVWGWLERPNPRAIKAMVDSIRLLRKREMEELFPDCKIMTERLLGIFPKAYIAVRLREDPAEAGGGEGGSGKSNPFRHDFMA